MAKEIERKFLVSDDSYKSMAILRRHIIQGYLSRRKESTVRVRIADDRAFITIKGANRGIARDEWEYTIPLADAEAMLSCCEGRVIDKTRWIVPFEGLTWEVDEFSADLSPLVLAEIELPDEAATFPLPPFVGKEVTGDPAYYNSNL